MACSNNVKGIGVCRKACPLRVPVCLLRFTRLHNQPLRVTEPVENPPSLTLCLLSCFPVRFSSFSSAAGPIDSSPLASKDF
ncbi:hypothetical protein V6N13_002698 [Hibiscus sabdariffa]